MVRSAARMSGVPRFLRGRIAVPAVMSGVALALGVPAAMAATSATAAHPKVIATVKVGTEPSEVAVSPRTGAAYVVNRGSSTVTVISARTNKVAATIRIKPGKRNLAPFAVAVSAVSGDVYVTNYAVTSSAKGTVTVISGRTNKVIGTIPVGIDPGQAFISPKTGDVYVTNSGVSSTSSTVTVINGRTNKVITTIKLGGSSGAQQGTAISPKTGDIYVANQSKDSVSVISGKTNKVIASVSVAYASEPSGEPLDPYAVAVSPVTGAVYVVSEGYHTGNLVTVISGKTNKVTAVIPNEVTYFGGSGQIAISPKTGTVYVGNDMSGNVSVISGKTNKLTGLIEFPDGYLHAEDVAVSPVTGDVYVENVIYGVTSPGGGESAEGAFWVINGKTNKLSGHVVIKDGVSISQGAISPRTGDAYSTGSANDVSVISG
jgi:YVTN family beta-propeller protein